MKFEVVGNITGIETIAVGSNIRELSQLRTRYGRGRWRKLKGIATVQLFDGTIRLAEVHWYEAHGIGRQRIAYEDQAIFGLIQWTKKAPPLNLPFV